MSQEKNLYFPIFYTACENTDSLSDEDFGILIRTLLKHASDRITPEGLKPILIPPYKFILEAAIRVFDSRGKGQNSEKNPQAYTQRTETKKGHIDYDAAYERAVERSYGKK